MMMNYLLELFGPNQLALGTDYPFPLGELQPGSLIDSMPYTDDIKERLNSGTALEWLGLEKSRFI
jgi:aminocarboxymuconate-semialdehyde decarboxylase